MCRNGWIIFHMWETGCGQPLTYGYHTLIKINANTLRCIGHHPWTPVDMIPRIDADMWRDMSLSEVGGLYSDEEFAEADEVTARYAAKLLYEKYGIRTVYNG